MRLRVKSFEWEAGLPVAMLDKYSAEQIGVHAKDRIFIRKASNHSKPVSTIIDVSEGLIKKNNIAVSNELREILNLRKNELVKVELAPSPESLNMIKKKLDGKKLSEYEIQKIIQDVVDNSLSEAEIALFVSAMYRNGMSFEETVFLVRAIVETGSKLKIRGKYIVDKHSIGGIPGNRTTPIVVAICAAAGLIFPKSSSRAITTSAGTADVIETVAKVDFSMKEIEKIVRKTGACLVFGGSLGMAPADSKIINVEKQLKIDPESQLLASIMAKKLAANSNYILIDIPYGKTAKVNKRRAKKLKKKFEKLGKVFKKNIKVVLTKGDEPMGEGVGPLMEMKDVLAVLNPKETGPSDLEEKSLFLSAQLLEMTGKAKPKQGFELARSILYSGKAFEKFKQIIKAQGGKLSLLERLPLPKFSKIIFATKNLKIKEIDNKKINSLARAAGAPADKFAGLKIHISVDDKIKKGDKILTLYANSKSRLKEAFQFYNKEKPISF